MLCALIGVERESELLDAAQALKLRRVNQAHHQTPFVRVGAKADDVVNRVAVDAFRHYFRLFFKNGSANDARAILSCSLKMDELLGSPRAQVSSLSTEASLA